jgi:hypothetical protein
MNLCVFTENRILFIDLLPLISRMCVYVVISMSYTTMQTFHLKEWDYFFQWMCIPFAMYNEHVGSLSPEVVDWVGKVDSSELYYYIDSGLLLIFGGIPWQVS